MKIKQVCEKTGLTDRAVRYYIEEGLIAPHYTENYLGRKAFEFSELNIRELQDIATLRDFSFSIEEIREILAHPENSQAVIDAVRARTAEKLEEETRRLEALSLLDREQMYTVPELAKALTAQGIVPKTEETVHFNLPKLLLRFLKSVVIFILVWLPIFNVIIISALSYSDYAYPIISYRGVLFTLLCIVPSIMFLLLSKITFSWKRIAKRILAALCAICVPFALIVPIGIVTCSETTDFKDYRDLDAECIANRSTLFQQLFPAWPHYFENVKQEDGTYETVYLDAKYYYHYYQGVDYTYDIYAEWPLGGEDFAKEIERVTNVFEEYDYVELKKGNYQCLIIYSGAEPFTTPTNNYSYLIFAYDEHNLRVRYILCDSLENGVDHPYYLTLDW